MSSKTSRLALVFLSAALGITAAQPANFSGTWHLDQQKSRWGALQKPLNVILTIDHKDPALKYSGTVLYADIENRDFTFDGALDGKPYAMVRSYGAGTIVLRRVDPYTFESVFKTEDGAYVESARTSVSKDGKVLTRALRLQTPDGPKSWTEVYQRQ